MSFIFRPNDRPSISIDGIDARFPVRRIYCVARNYAEHAREMGTDPTREAPFFFMKPADAIIENGVDIPYPSRTDNLHHEVELVVALGKGGSEIPIEKAQDYIFGYAVGNDLTRRDLQQSAKTQGRPWDTSKGFDHSAVIGAIFPAADIGHISEGKIWLKVDDTIKQQGNIRDMLWDVPEIIAELSRFFEVKAGDLIYTGTPAGVGPLLPGQKVTGYIEGLDTLTNKVV